MCYELCIAASQLPTAFTHNFFCQILCNTLCHYLTVQSVRTLIRYAIEIWGPVYKTSQEFSLSHKLFATSL